MMNNKCLCVYVINIKYTSLLLEGGCFCNFFHYVGFSKALEQERPGLSLYFLLYLSVVTRK